MCLETISCGMTYDKKRRCFVGVGYKYMELDKYRTDRWIKAVGVRPEDQNKNMKPDYTLLETDRYNNNKYFPGFHIFSKIDDAFKYGIFYDSYHTVDDVVNAYKRNYETSYYSKKRGIVRVIYKDMIVAGTNRLEKNRNKISIKPGDCCIALQMKIDKIFSPQDFKKMIVFNACDGINRFVIKDSV